MQIQIEGEEILVFLLAKKRGENILFAKTNA